MDGSDYFHGVNERILARVPVEACRILDVGCASGALGSAIKRRVIEAGHAAPELWGIELNPVIAREAKAQLDHVIVGNVEDMKPLPLPERFFDCAICGDLLEHLKDPGGFLNELRNHLAPDGILIVNVPNVSHWTVIVQLLQGRFDYADKGLLDRTHLRFFTPSSLREMMWEAKYLVQDGEGLVVRIGPSPESGPPDPGPTVLSALESTADRLGLDAQLAKDSASVYQQLYVAKPVPDPFSMPSKMEALVGPHIGKLGHASKRASIVILTYNSMKTIEACLHSVLPTLTAEDELILVDNASLDGTPEYLRDFCERESRTGPASISVILNEENMGFSKGCNIGILQSLGTYLVLLNPDTQVWPGWVERLIEPFAAGSIGAVGPLSDNVCGDQFVGIHVPNDKITPLERVAELVNSEDLQLKCYAVTRLLIGFCLALRRDLLDQFGLLEEACFLGADDLELSWRLRALGYELAIAMNVFVAHDTHTSFRTISADAKQKVVHESDAGLIRKLVAYYGTKKLPTSNELWKNDIFSEAMNR